MNNDPLNAAIIDENLSMKAKGVMTTLTYLEAANSQMGMSMNAEEKRHMLHSFTSDVPSAVAAALRELIAAKYIERSSYRLRLPWDDAMFKVQP